MNTSWMVGGFILFLVGVMLTLSIIGSVLGIPMIFISVIILIVGIFIPGRKKTIKEVHHHK